MVGVAVVVAVGVAVGVVVVVAVVVGRKKHMSNTIVTSGERNGKTWKISYNGEENSYELAVYNRAMDQFEEQGGEFNSLAEAEEYLDNTYGKVAG